jgi:hypothetical protein
MTLVAITTGPDYAEVLVDTLAYGFGDAEFVQTAKVRSFPHLDLVIAGKGAAEMPALWSLVVDGTPSIGDFDALCEAAVEELPDLWETVEQKEQRRSCSLVYMVGWSPSRRRFVALEFSADADFQPREVGREEAFCTPAPGDAPAVPTRPAEWIDLAETIYAEHSVTLDLSQKTMIGGGLILTRLERGSVTQRRIQDLPADDWRFRQMVIGTVHRYGQIGPCMCGSGQPYLVCHLPAFDPEWPCPCTSGKPFVDCHRLEPHDPEVFDHWMSHPEDFHRTKDELQTNWDRAFPDEPRFEPPQIIDPQAVSRDLVSQLRTPAPQPLLSRAERRAAAREAARASRRR